jgi:hypothetical protein
VADFVGFAAGDWRLGGDLRRAYEAKVKAMEDKKRASGQKLRAMWEEKEREKAQKALQVRKAKYLILKCILR